MSRDRDAANERLRRLAVQHGLEVGQRVDHVEARVDVVEDRIDELAPPRPVPPRPTPRQPFPAAAPVVVEESIAAPHRDAAIERVRQASDAELEHAAALGGVIAHNERIEATQAVMGRALVILARELGVQEQLDPSLRRSVPPPAPNAPTARATVARTNTRSLVAAALAASLAFADLALKLVEVYERHRPH